MNDVERLIKALERPIKESETTKWPIQASRISQLFLIDFTNEFIKEINRHPSVIHLLNTLKARKLTPTSVWKLMHHLLKGFDIANISIATRRQVVNIMIDAIKQIKAGDPYNEEGQNIILSNNELIKMFSSIPIQKSPSFCIATKKLSGLMWGYLESALFAARCEAMEIHGPYNSGNTNILVKDYFDLDMEGLLDKSTILPFRNMNIIEQVSATDIYIDVYDNISFLSSRAKNEMQGCAVIVDGVIIDRDEEINEIIKMILPKLVNLYEKVTNLSLTEQSRRYAEIFWYRKRKWLAAEAHTWCPEEKLLEKINVSEVSTSSSLTNGRKKWLEEYVYILREENGSA